MITGMISMILTNSKNKIHICAPSNGAVDEILKRIKETGFKDIDILRISASSYKISEDL